MKMKKLVEVKVNGKSVYIASSSELRIGSRGSLVQAGLVFRLLGKSNARKLRKSLRTAGFAGMAAIPAVQTPF